MTQGFISSTLTLPVPVTSGGTGLTSTTINQLLYSSAANTIAGLATANNGVLVTSAGGVPSISSTLPPGIAATNMTLTTPTLGAASATSLSFSSTSEIIGTTTNNSAAAGSVGEWASASLNSGSATSLTSSTSKNVAQFDLTAGDWDVFGYVGFTGTAAITSGFGAGINTTSATIPSLSSISDGASVSYIAGSGVGFLTYGDSVLGITPCRISIASTTTVYLVARVAFSGGGNTALAYGTIRARRRR